MVYEQQLARTRTLVGHETRHEDVHSKCMYVCVCTTQIDIWPVVAVHCTLHWWYKCTREVNGLDARQGMRTVAWWR